MTPTGAEVQSRSDFSTGETMTDPQRRVYTPDASDVSVREVTDEDAEDGTWRIRAPATSTAEARDGEAFSREKVEGFAAQAEGTPVFLDHGRNEHTGSRYSAAGRVGVVENPELRERDGVTDLLVDFVLMDPNELPEDAGWVREALTLIRAQAEAGMPITSSVGWSEDTGERDLPGDVDWLETSLVGIPSDARASTELASAEAAPKTLARAVSAASSGFDVRTFIRTLRQAEGVDTVQVPTYDEAANPDGVAWDGLDLEDFEAVIDDPSPQDSVVYEKFAYSATGFPPAEDATFDSLDYPLATVDGTLLWQALTDADEVHPAGLEGDEETAMAQVLIELSEQEFPGETLPELGDRGRATDTVAGEEIDLTPPDAVVNAAEAAVNAKAEYADALGDCGTGDGEETARRIREDDLTADYVADEIAAYLTSHADDVAGINDPPTDWERETWTDGCGPVQYALWGGTATGTGRDWAQGVANDVARAKGEDLPYPDRNSMTQTHNLDDPEFSEGDAVEWSSNDATVRGRVADIGDEFVVGGGDVTITGDEGEAVYLIHELDDSLEPPQYRRANVAKPESSLDESQADLPPLEGNFADEENAMSDSTEPDEESGTDRDESDGMDAAEFRESMLEMQREQTDLLQTLATDMDGDDEDDEDEDDDMEEDSADAPEAEAAADAEGEERTVTLDGEERAVNEALAELREQASEAEPEEPQTQDRADEEHSEETDTTGGFGFAAVED